MTPKVVSSTRQSISQSLLQYKVSIHVCHKRDTVNLFRRLGVSAWRPKSRARIASATTVSVVNQFWRANDVDLYSLGCRNCQLLRKRFILHRSYLSVIPHHGGSITQT